MPFIAEMWFDGACRNSGRVDGDRPVLGGVGVYYPVASEDNLCCRRRVPLPGNVQQDTRDATSNRECLLRYPGT